MKHTPFPWKRDRYNSLLGPDGRTITVWSFGIAHGNRTPETEANTAVFEAAPELLEALKEALCWMPSGSGETPAERGAKCETRLEAVVQITAAIDKAEGRS